MMNHAKRKFQVFYFRKVGWDGSGSGQKYESGSVGALCLSVSDIDMENCTNWGVGERCG